MIKLQEYHKKMIKAVEEFTPGKLYEMMAEAQVYPKGRKWSFNKIQNTAQTLFNILEVVVDVLNALSFFLQLISWSVCFQRRREVKSLHDRCFQNRKHFEITLCWLH